MMKAIAGMKRVGIMLCVAGVVLLAMACGKPAEETAVKRAGVAAGKLPAILNAMPESTIVALALTDLDRWRSDLKKTALNDAWEDPNLKLWREQSWPKFKKLMAERTPFTADEIDGLIHGDALVVVGLTLEPNQTEPKPRVAVLLRPTSNKAQVEAFLQKILALAGGNPPVQKWAGDVLILTDQEPFAAELAANLQAGRSPLESSKAYGVLKSQFASGGFAHVWLNAEKLVGLIFKSSEKDGKPEIKAILDKAGLANLLALYSSMSVREKGFLSTMRLQCDGPRQGVLAWVGENAPSKAVRLTPHDAQGFFSVRLAGMDKILTTIHAITQARPGFNEQQWQQAMTQAGAVLRINVESDLPKMVGKELAVVVGGGGLGLAMQISLYVESPNPSLLMTTAERFLAMAQIQPSQTEQQGMSYKYFSIPQSPLPFEISYGQVGDFVVVSTQQKGLVDAITALKSKKSLADNPNYAKAIAMVGKPGWSESFTGVDRNLGAQAGMFAPMIVPALNKALGTNLTFGDIPNLQAFVDHQFPSVGRARITADAIESQRYGMIGLGMSVPVAGAAAAVAIIRVKAIRQLPAAATISMKPVP